MKTESESAESAFRMWKFIFYAASEFSDSFKSSTSPTTLPANGNTERTMLPDTERLEEPTKIYIATDDALPLPMMLEDINFFGQGYPIWIKNDPYQVKDETGRRYHAPQELYKILLPPYEPVILVDNTRRGQFLPFFTDAFDHLFDEVLMSLPEVTPTGIYVIRNYSTE